MNRKNKWKAKLALALLPVALSLALAGCTPSPDSVEDPLAEFGVDSLLPFATADPGTIETTATPAPTIDINATPAPVEQDWQSEGAEGYEELSYGDSGDAVKNLQNRLKELGYFEGTVDGNYTNGTASAVRLFQTTLGVTKTGIASASLQKMLFSSSAPRYNSNIDDGSGDDYTDDDYDYDDDYDEVYEDPTKAPSPTSSSSSSGYQTLSTGMTGTAVKNLQSALKELGYYTGSVDGVYGSGTATAVKRFQKMYGKNQTGVATAALQKKLFSGDAVRYSPTATPTPQPTQAPSSDYPMLSYGDSGTAVKNLQNRLKKLGYYTGTVDGNYGSGTVNAVKRFQKALGWEATGIASSAMQTRLYASSAPTYAPTTTPTPTPQSGYVQLEPGDTGERVKELQARLKELGYFDGDIGGNYLTKTTKAVKRFQKALGLEQTGVATVALQKELFSADAPVYRPSATATPAPTPESGEYQQLKEGDKNAAVKRLQQRLKELGYYTGSITGGFGAKTTDAVKRFQKAIDHKQTGVATVSMQKILFSDDAPRYDAPVVTPAATAEYIKLKPGDTGERVKNLQRRLKELGYFDGDIGGNYLTKTTNAVKAFQKAIGEKQDGIATVSLQQRLFSSSAPAKGETSDETYTSLRRGDSGAEVYELQIRLIELGFMDDCEADGEGVFGYETMSAVISAQMERGYDSDGVADGEFLKFIYSDDAWSIAQGDTQSG